MDVIGPDTIPLANPAPAARSSRSLTIESTDDLKFGEGRIETVSVGGRSCITRLAARAPLKLLSTRTRESRNRGPAATVFTSTYGGGLLARDRIDLHVHCRPDSALALRTQSATKVYRSVAGEVARQRLSAQMEDRATLVSLPDPVTCYADAAYEQTQTISLGPDASLLLLDWFTAGRSARGERWAFEQYASRTEIRRNGHPVFLDSMRLDRDDGSIVRNFRGGRFGCVAMLVLMGPTFVGRAAALKAELDARAVVRRASLIAVASPIDRDAGGVVFRVASETTESATRFLAERLGFLSALIGHDPFGRKW